MHKPPHTAIFALALFAATACFAAPPQTDDATLNTRINQALTKGADYLLAKKEEGDHFGTEPLTGLELYTLLEIGRSIDDPRLRPNSPELARVVRWLGAQFPDGAIAAAMKALGLSDVPATPELKTAAGQAREALLALVCPDGYVKAYPDAPAPNLNFLDQGDVVWVYIALACLEDSGHDIDPKIWKNAGKSWRDNQQKDGAWEGGDSTPSDTAAGLCMLYLTNARIRAVPTPPVSPDDPQIAAALNKVVADFDPKSKNYPYLYLFQRAASAAGLRSIHGQDWFRTAAEEILKAQKPDGSWPGIGGPLPEFCDADAHDTAYALLFLAQGRAPVIFSKLDYGNVDTKSAPWNAHPRDDANLTAWLSCQLDQPLNWQMLPLRDTALPWQGAPESPILLITGSGDPNFSPDDLAKLRTFVQSGGLIFSCADNTPGGAGADPAFTDAIVKKYAPALAEKRYEMRALPPNHPLFDASLFAKITAPPPLLGLSNGVREWWIHCPNDLALSWQNRKFANRDDFSLPANLLRYATGNGSLKNKLETPAAAPPAIASVVRTIHLARLDYEGNPDPEPLAWPRLAAFAPARFHTAVEISTVKPAQLDGHKTPVAHITGTTAFALSDSDRTALKNFLDHGGTLLADSAGASPKFTAAFRELAQKLYSGAALAEIPINDPLYNGSLPDSFRLTEVQYRKYALLQMKDHQVKPRIQAVTVNGRHVILFSPEDITSGLLGTETWGIQGYAPDSAFALARNMLLYAAQK